MNVEKTARVVAGVWDLANQLIAYDYVLWGGCNIDRIMERLKKTREFADLMIANGIYTKDSNHTGVFCG